MVKRMLEYIGVIPEGQVPVSQAPRRTDNVRQMPAARPAAPRPTARRGYEPAYATIHTLRPRRYSSDAENIAYIFREGSPVVVDLSQMQEMEVRRILDYMSGLVKGLDGTIKRASAKVFVLSPAGIDISDEDQEAEALRDEVSELLD